VQVVSRDRGHGLGARVHFPADAIRLHRRQTGCRGYTTERRDSSRPTTPTGSSTRSLGPPPNRRSD
jgi:hypothetical protein